MVALVMLARMAFVALYFALTVVAINHCFADGLLQARPGLPESAWWWVGLGFAGLVLPVATLALLPR